MNREEQILVIKLGALGDLVQATGPFAAIYTRHATAFRVLLTRQTYADFIRQSPYFDAIWVDERPELWQVSRLLVLRTRLQSGRFNMVYDLQTSDRSSFYFRLMGQPPWSGTARGCAYLHANPGRDHMHTLDRQAEQLAMAGIPVIPEPDLSWIRSDRTARFGLKQPFVLLVGGGTLHRPDKRWPAEHYATLAKRLVQRGYTPVLIGTDQDRSAVDAIIATCLQAVDLSAQTSFADLVGLGRHAVAAVGNDTGPMHLLAVSGCPCVVLYGSASDPALCAPRGAHVVLLRSPYLADIAVATVEAMLPF